MAVEGLAATNHAGVAASYVEGLLSAAEGFGYRLPELYGGLDQAAEQVPTPYPLACRPQAWAAASPVAIADRVARDRPGRPARRPVGGAGPAVPVAVARGARAAGRGRRSVVRVEDGPAHGAGGAGVAGRIGGQLEPRLVPGSLSVTRRAIVTIRVPLGRLLPLHVPVATTRLVTTPNSLSASMVAVVRASSVIVTLMSPGSTGPEPRHLRRRRACRCRSHLCGARRVHRSTHPR